MAYYGGGTLLDKINQQALTLDQALKIVRSIAGGLQKAHAKNIVHRDVKPANILFSEDGEPKLIDFGLAKFLEHRPVTGIRFKFNYDPAVGTFDELVSGWCTPFMLR
jgi:serine/threonine protein kinase